MSNETRVSKLERLRGALKTKLTRFENFLNKSSDEINKIELKRKITEVDILKDSFEDKQTEIESLVSDAQIETEYEQRGDFEETFRSKLLTRIIK